MKTTLAANPQYRLEVSSVKNRAYLTIIGFWRNPEQVAHYISDWQKALAYLKPGFTLLTDAREMKIHPASVRSLHEQAQKMVVEAGIKAVAELQGEKITEFQLDGLSKDSKMPKQNFSSEEEAEHWLDSQH